MRRKSLFFLAGIFLAVALVVPSVLLFLQADQDLDNMILAQNPSGHQTSGNITLTDQTSENHQNTLLSVIVIDVAFVVLFGVTLYFAVNTPPSRIER